jgi:hypothetical protein
MSMALVEICVGIAAGFAADRFFGPDALGANVEWLRFLAASGAVLLTFLAGAELDPAVLRAKWKEVTVVGLFSFAAPFLGCAAIAYYLMGWDPQASWLAGVALSTTSMAVVYAVMLKPVQPHRVRHGDSCERVSCRPGTVIALGSFSPRLLTDSHFCGRERGGDRTAAVPHQPDQPRYAHRTAAVRAKWVLLVLFAGAPGTLVGE